MNPRRPFSRFSHARHRERWLAAFTTRWQQRLMFILGGLLVGCAAVMLAVSADSAQRTFIHWMQRYPWSALLITPAGFCLCIYVGTRWFKNSQGSGIPQTIAAYLSSDESYRKKLVSLRVAFGKIVLTVSGLLFGASTGREGPTVQVGAAIMLAMGRLSPRRQRGVVVAGAAAGVAAAFNTPLAGIMFGIEEMSRSFDRHTSGLIIGCVIAAGFTALGFLGNYTYFGSSGDEIVGVAGWLAVPVCGVVGGLAGGLFSRMMVSVTRGAGRLMKWQTSTRGKMGMAMVCGLVVAICGLLSSGAVYGTGYLQVKDALENGARMDMSFVGLKFIATLASSFSGIPGGIFAPSLAIGAGLGSDLAMLFTGDHVGVMLLLGMAAYLAGVVQAPITAFVIVMEMTNNHGMLMPLMATALIASGSSRLICREGIYHALAHDLLDRRRHLVSGQ
jgi:chloride channel protein, CIC family